MTHCKLYDGDHSYCEFGLGYPDEECLCSCKGCSAAREEADRLRQQELQEIKDYEHRWKNGTMEQVSREALSIRPLTEEEILEKHNDKIIGSSK